ncbi:hypothetical protein [Oceanobacillus sp. FSL W7-1309]|uniref:hypothetical protein n=1 Tax=Oceanobacillus sp. FSL W7-1309 TaxID=2954539 RepID=UPI0030F66031
MYNQAYHAEQEQIDMLYVVGAQKSSRASIKEFVIKCVLKKLKSIKSKIGMPEIKSLAEWAV